MHSQGEFANNEPSGYYMYQQINIQQFYVLPTQRIYVFCVNLRTNSDYFPIQHYLTGFYNRDGVCLLGGTLWILKVHIIRQVNLSFYGKCLLSLPPERSLQRAHLLYKRLGGPQMPRGHEKSLLSPKIENGLSSRVSPSLVNTPI